AGPSRISTTRRRAAPTPRWAAPCRARGSCGRRRRSLSREPSPAPPRPADVSEFRLNFSQGSLGDFGQQSVEDLQQSYSFFFTELVVLGLAVAVGHHNGTNVPHGSVRPRRALAPERQRQHVHNTKRL